MSLFGQGFGFRQYHGVGPVRAALYGSWNALMLGWWAFAVTSGVLLALRFAS